MVKSIAQATRGICKPGSQGFSFQHPGEPLAEPLLGLRVPSCYMMAVAPDGAKGPPGFALPHQTELRGLYGLGLALLSINGLSWPPPESHFGILTSYIHAAAFSTQMSVTTAAMGTLLRSEVRLGASPSLCSRCFSSRKLMRERTC